MASKVSAEEQYAEFRARMSDSSGVVRRKVLEEMSSMDDEESTLDLDESFVDDVAKLVSDPEHRVRSAACRTLSGFRRNVNKHVPAIIRLLQEDEHYSVKRAAANAIISLGAGLSPGAGREDVIQALVEQVGSNDITMRCRVAQGFASLKATACVEELGVLLHDNHPEVRGHALHALASLGPAAAGKADAVAAMLPEFLLRLEVINALCRFGEAGARHAPEFLRFLESESPKERYLRDAVVEALQMLRPHLSVDVWIRLEELSAHTSETVAASAREALKRIGPKPAA